MPGAARPGQNPKVAGAAFAAAARIADAQSASIESLIVRNVDFISVC
jgi:hypothetical protein